MVVRLIFMTNGSVSKQGDVVLRRQGDGSTFDAAPAILPGNIGGGTSAVTDVAAALSVPAPCVLVRVQAAMNNLSILHVGNAGAQPIELDNGQYVDIPIDDASKIFVRMAAGVGTANYLIFA